MNKPWYKSRVLWLNAALAMGTVVEANFGVIQAALGPHAYLGGVAAIAGINCVLRTVTTQPIRRKKDCSQ